MTSPRYCPCCSEDDKKTITLTSGNIYSCGGCGHSWRTENIEYDYDDHPMHSETSDDRMQPAYDLLELFYTDNMHVLEVGVSDGNYAKLLRRTVPFRSYEGVELSPAIKEASSKVDAVHNMTIQQLASGKKPSYDLIICNHTLEHIGDIADFFRAFDYLLSNGGMVYLEVPNRSGHPRFYFDENTAHLHFFSVTSISQFLQTMGYVIIELRTAIFYNQRCPRGMQLLAMRAGDLIDQSPKYRISSLKISGPVIVWGVGSQLAIDDLRFLMNTDEILLYVDRDPKKHGRRCYGVDVSAPTHIANYDNYTLYINSLLYEHEIRAEALSIANDRIKDIVTMNEAYSLKD